MKKIMCTSRMPACQVADMDRPLPGWKEDMRDELDEFFLDPTASESAKDGYLVLRANIHVTMAMTRLRLM
jgi:hypothetical protein